MLGWYVLPRDLNLLCKVVVVDMVGLFSGGITPGKGSIRGVADTICLVIKRLDRLYNEKKDMV